MNTAVHRKSKQSRWAALVAMWMLTAAISVSEAQHNHSGADEKRAALLPGMGQHHHSISTSSLEAQKFYDQGLTLVFGFNRAEAVRSFRREGTHS